MPSEFVFEPRSPTYGPFLVSGCWCTLRSFWGFLAPFWAVSRTYRGVRGHQRSLGREKVKLHVHIYIYIYIYVCIYIYIYILLHPSPLSNKQASNKQATSKQQALLLSVLAIARPHRSGLYSTLATLEPRWCPCQIQVLSQKLTGGGPGRWRQVRRCPPQSAHFWAKSSHFSPKTAPKPGRYIYYYTPLPLNLANKQATSKQQASNKHFSFPFWPLLGLIAPGSTLLYAPSREVPSQNCAFCAPRQPFLAQNCPETRSKRTNERKRFVHITCASIAP